MGSEDEVEQSLGRPCRRQVQADMQGRTFSALPLKAEIVCRKLDVSLGPLSNIRSVSEAELNQPESRFTAYHSDVE
jgi:hypothetical protein